jgi:hypothetical protein
LKFSVPPLEEKKSEEPKLITMSHSDLVSNPLCSKDLSRKLLTDLGITEEALKKNPRRCDQARLEIKITWLRSVVDLNSLRMAMILHIKI